MSKELSEEAKYEFNVFARQLNKDLSNLMEYLRKQDEDNKAILYAGKHIQKIILPVEEYQKMCQRLESIDNANTSEALECLEKIVDKGRINDGSCCHWRECLSKNKCNFNNDNLMCPDYIRANTIKQTLIKAQEQEKVLKILFEKNVDIKLLKWCINNPKKLTTPLLNYNINMNENEELTEEEFDLLKRYFK